MTMQTADETIQFNSKSGKGIRDGVVSELSAFFEVRPGHEDAVRAACQRFTATLQQAPRKETMKTGLRYTRHVLFDGGRRLLWTTGFETDWDPYIEDALVVVGVDHFIDWMQHTTAYDQIDAVLREAGGIEAIHKAMADPTYEQSVRMNTVQLKEIIKSVQTPAIAYFDALADKSVPEIRKALELDQAFQQVLDSPDAAQALQQPALQPLLEQAAA